MEAAEGQGIGLKPLARWAGAASAGLDPSFMGWSGPARSESCLTRSQIRLEDVPLVEINEAFRRAILACVGAEDRSG